MYAVAIDKQQIAFADLKGRIIDMLKSAPVYHIYFFYNLISAFFYGVSQNFAENSSTRITVESFVEYILGISKHNSPHLQINCLF